MRCIATDDPPGIDSADVTAFAPVTVRTHSIASAGGSARNSARVAVPRSSLRLPGPSSTITVSPLPASVSITQQQRYGRHICAHRVTRHANRSAVRRCAELCRSRVVQRPDSDKVESDRESRHPSRMPAPARKRKSSAKRRTTCARSAVIARSLSGQTTFLA